MTDTPENNDPNSHWPKEAPPKKVSHYHETKPPKLWSMIYIGTIIWAVGIWLLYPVWPALSIYSLGLLGYSTRVELEQTVEAQAAERAPNKEWALETDPEATPAESAELQEAVARGRSAFAINCSQCHGRDAKGTDGFPNLTDSDWLWPHSADELEATIRHGIRQPGDDETRAGDMPAFVRDGILSRDQALDAAHYVISLSGGPHDAESAQRGATVFEENCASCHGETATGTPELGAPNLTDKTWLYGGDLDTVFTTISHGRAGVMPAWTARLDDGTIRQIVLYLGSIAEQRPEAEGR